MANSIDITLSNGVYTVRNGTQVVGQGRTLETALENAVTGPPPEYIFHAAEVLMDIMGPVRSTHSQIATREP